MATSSSTNFELDVAEYIEEAFERCGLEARTGYDLQTARRSMNIMLAEWANRGLNQWTIEQRTQALTADSTEYSLGTDIIDVLSVVVKRGTTDFSMSRISRDTYINIPTKSTTGRPTQFYVNRHITPTVRVWPTPENNTDIFIYDRLVRIDDADAATDTVQIPFRFYPCLAAGLAYYIALKRAPERVQILKGLYEEEFTRAAEEDRDKASLSLVPSYTFVSAVS